MFSKDNIKQEHIQEAYRLLSEYCIKEKKEIIPFIENKDNIKPASEYIYNQLNFALRLVLKPKSIEKMILENFDWILSEAKKLHSKK